MSDHAQAHPAHLAHHFADDEQQRESAKLGMWIFLLTEILLFGGLFCAYAVFRLVNPDMFHNAHQHLNVTLGLHRAAHHAEAHIGLAVFGHEAGDDGVE